MTDKKCFVCGGVTEINGNPVGMVITLSKGVFVHFECMIAANGWKDATDED